VPALNATTLLAAWEQGVSQHPLQRAVALLNLARPQKSTEEWARVTVGQRDLQLLQFREKLFGPKIEATAVCPKCGSELELNFTARDLQLPAAKPYASNEHLKLVAGDYEIDYRLPTTVDLLEVANGSGQAVAALVDRCVEARHQGNRIQSDALPAPIIELVGTNMAEADPYADIQIALDCAGCLHRWSMVFDVVSYLWDEIEDWAERLIRDVHSLAAAYGWSEREIVGMSARRRRLYLELASA
jgi:hypothetical protein